MPGPNDDHFLMTTSLAIELRFQQLAEAVEEASSQRFEKLLHILTAVPARTANMSSHSTMEQSVGASGEKDSGKPGQLS
jgi:hypothetical protein